MDDLSKPRVNASMLARYQGRTVCVLGTAKNVDSNGTQFTLTTSDGHDIKINMQEPLGEYVSGLTEVHGQVSGENSITCENYVGFPQELSENFDMGLYNEAIEVTARLEKYYIVGVQG